MDADDAKLNAYLDARKRAGRRVPSDSSGQHPHLVRISAASGASRRALFKPQSRRRIAQAVEELGLEPKRGTRHVREKTHAEQDLELICRYLLWLESTGVKLPENPARRGRVFFAQVKIEAGVAAKALCPRGSKTTDIASPELARLLEESVPRLGLEIRILPQVVGYDGASFTYQTLLNSGTAERRRELEGKPRAEQQLYNTKSALFKFCRTLGLEMTADVGREFVADFDTSVDKVFAGIGNAHSRRKFQTEIRRWFDWYQQLVRGCALPAGFRESFAMLVDRFGLPFPMLAKLLGADTTTLRAWYRGSMTPSPESLPAIARLETICKLPTGSLVSKVAQHTLMGRILPSHLPERFRGKEFRPIVGRVCRHLPPEFLQMPPEKQQEVFDWIRNNVIRCNHPYNLRLSELKKLPYGLRAWPARLAAEFEGLARFKMAQRPTLGMTRNQRWGAVTRDMSRKEFGQLFGALGLPDDPSVDVRVRGLGLPEEGMTLALLACPLVIDWYIRFRCQHRTQHTGMIVNLLQRYKSMVREGTGWLRQRPDLARRLRLITWVDPEDPDAGPKELVSAELVAKAQTDWDGVCQDAFSFYERLIKEIEPLVTVARDPFRCIEGIINMDDPLDAFDLMLEGMRRELPNQHTQPFLYHAAIRDCALIALIAATGFRRNTIAQLRYEGDGMGHLILREESVVLNVPRRFFKNPESSYFGTKDKKTDYYNELPNVYWIVDFLTEYLNVSRPFLLSHCHLGREEQPLFVSSGGGREVGMSPMLISSVYHKSFERHLVRNEYRGTGIPKVWPTGPHSARHTRGTAIVRETGSFRLAGDANQHTEKMAYKFYADFTTKDRNRLVNALFEKRVKKSSRPRRRDEEKETGPMAET